MFTCSIIGHNPKRFKFKYKETNTGCKRIKKRLKEQIAALYESGIHAFLISGILGVDIWAGEIILQMKKEPQYSGLELTVIVPFDENDRRWDERSKRRLANLKKHSSVVIVGNRSGEECYFQREQYMLSHADCLIAVFDNDFTIQSNVARVVSHALKTGMPIVYIHPDNAGVSYSKKNRTV